MKTIVLFLWLIILSIPAYAQTQVNPDWIGPLEISWGRTASSAAFAALSAETESIPTSEHGLFGASHTLNFLTAYKPSIGVFGIGVNDNATLGTTTWAGYFEAHKINATVNGAYGIEIDARDLVTAIIPNAYRTGDVETLRLAAGAGLAATGQYPISAYIEAIANPQQAEVGIVMASGSLDPTNGLGGGGTAVELATGMDIVWRNNATNIIADMYANTNGVNLSSNLILGPTNGSFLGMGRAFVVNAPASTLSGAIFRVNGALGGYLYTDANSELALMAYTGFGLDLGGNNATDMTLKAGVMIGAPTGSTQGVGTLNVAGKYYANGTPGVTCSGIPTSLFAVVNGIVTHC